MANLTESPVYESGIFQLEKSTPAVGGPPVIDGGIPSAGHANAQAQQLANRTAYLKQQLDDGGSATNLATNLADKSDPTKGAALSGWDGSTVGEQMNLSKKLANYTALSNYKGTATRIELTQSGIAGPILRDPTVTVGDGGTTFLDGLGRGWRRSFKGAVHADWFDDGVATDAAALQGALNTGASKVFGLSRNASTTAALSVMSDYQTLVLDDAFTLTLSTANAATPVINVFGKKSKVVGGRISYTLRTLKFALVLTGAGSKLKDCEVFFATKSTLVSPDGNIPYNQGGVSMVGDSSRVEGCDIYNHEGIGVVVYGLNCRVVDSDIHDNITGIHGTVSAGSVVERYLNVLNNRIYDNNVQHSSGACGIVTSYLTLLKMRGNEVTGNGEHGTYIYSAKSIITNNHFSGNYRQGLKVRSAKSVILTENVIVDNNVEGMAGADLVVQAQDGNNPDPSNTKITIKDNVATSATGTGITISWVASGITVTKLIVSGNQAKQLFLAYNSAAIVTDNIIDGDILAAAQTAAAPANQSGGKFKNNICANLIIGRAVRTEFSGNTCANIDTTGAISGGDNKFIGNTVTAQTMQIGRGYFDDFIGNDINCAALAVPLLLQSSTRALNDNKNISFNKFRGHTQPVIADSTSAISGNNNRIVGNEFDSAGYALSFWGTGHTVMGNTNIGGGSVGYVGCNNSWLIGNSPKMVLRAEGTGNQNL